MSSNRQYRFPFQLALLLAAATTATACYSRTETEGNPQGEKLRDSAPANAVTGSAPRVAECSHCEGTPPQPRSGSVRPDLAACGVSEADSIHDREVGFVAELPRDITRATKIAECFERENVLRTAELLRSYAYLRSLRNDHAGSVKFRIFALRADYRGRLATGAATSDPEMQRTARDIQREARAHRVPLSRSDSDFLNKQARSGGPDS